MSIGIIVDATPVHPSRILSTIQSNEECKEAFMKQSKLAFAALLLLLLGAAGSASAHGHVGVVIGVPLGVPYYPRYYSPYYYSPAPVVVAPAAPPVYVEQQGQTPQAQESGNWYYCSNPAGYYPYVRQCPEGWQQVPAQPPSP
jgi:hypothetical protein